MIGPNGNKPKFAMYWAASCGGCEIAVLNIHEKILDVDANFDVVFWPVAMDAKYKDVEAMEDGSILLTLFNGGIRNDENEHIAKLLRQKSQILVVQTFCHRFERLAHIPAIGSLVRDHAHFSAKRVCDFFGYDCNRVGEGVAHTQRADHEFHRFGQLFVQLGHPLGGLGR